MKKIKYRYYKNNFGGRIGECKLGLISDLHLFKLDDQEKKFYSKLEKKIGDSGVEYLLVAGDLVDCNLVFDDKEKMKFLEEFFIRLSSKMKVIIVIGNHEFRGNRGDVSNLENWLINFGRNTRNVWVLDNRNVIIDKFNFIGMMMEGDWYAKRCERSQEFIDFYNRKIADLVVDGKCNVLLVHTPFLIMDDNVSKKLRKFKKLDLVVCGHSHDGIVKLPHNYGLFSPNLRLFRKYAHGQKGKVIVSSAIKTLSYSSYLNWLDFLFPAVITVISDSN